MAFNFFGINMIYKKILLKDVSSLIKSDAFLEVYLYDAGCEEYGVKNKRPGLLICPGGGYSVVSFREKDPVAFAFLSRGFHCFALTYTCNTPYPVPQLEVAVAFQYIKEHSKEFNLYEDSLNIIGFSAGGHLAGSYCYLYKELAKEYGLNESLLKPSSAALIYPVLLTGNKTHAGTANNISGGDETLKLKLDVVSHVDSDYPPTFLAHTTTDGAVPVDNTIEMVKALNNAGVLNEVHYYEGMPHGESLANYEAKPIYAQIFQEEKIMRIWPDLYADFVFEKILKFPADHK